MIGNCRIGLILRGGDQQISRVEWTTKIIGGLVDALRGALSEVVARYTQIQLN